MYKRNATATWSFDHDFTLVYMLSNANSSSAYGTYTGSGTKTNLFNYAGGVDPYGNRYGVGVMIENVKNGDTYKVPAFSVGDTVVTFLAILGWYQSYGDAHENRLLKFSVLFLPSSEYQAIIGDSVSSTAWLEIPLEFTCTGFATVDSDAINYWDINRNATSAYHSEKNDSAIGGYTVIGKSLSYRMQLSEDRKTAYYHRYSGSGHVYYIIVGVK